MKREPGEREIYTEYRGLAMRVLVAARFEPDIGEWAAYIGEWAAYCDAVPGMHHSQEYQEVLDHGDVLPEAVANELFPGQLEYLNTKREHPLVYRL